MLGSNFRIAAYRLPNPVFWASSGMYFLLMALTPRSMAFTSSWRNIRDSVAVLGSISREVVELWKLTIIFDRNR
ncbi:hypothetical protein WG66_005624 [Moniliophthora roreri]|nr:hypothetical protein WG66_005624 [Moniliophthora roreri]